jgi:histidinol-phosphate aminotransferase
MSFEDLAREHVRALSPYAPGFQPQGDGWIKINTNESPYPPSPAVAEAIKTELGRLRLYPDPAGSELRRAVARHCGVGDDEVIIGNGSDDVLNLLVRVFGGPGRTTGYTIPGYSLYPVLIGIGGGEGRAVEFERSMELPVDSIATSDTQLFFLTSPNAPTGVGFSNNRIRELLQTYPGILVVDEAYADFADENAACLLADHPNLVITRTLSKSHGLAGLRVGYALARPGVIDLLDRVRDSYNVNRLSQAGALASLADHETFQANLARILATREASLHFFRELGWFVYPPATNFLFAEPRDASGRSGAAVSESLFEFLMERKILVRRFPSHALTSGFLRFSVGADSEMRVLNQAIQSWLHTE